jgi:glyoxylase-like metal-dependent hydrolase (beta-lactamase superfamily II)
MRLLPNARFISTGAEWAAATGCGAAGNGYVSHHLPPRTRVELLDFGDRGERYGPFSSTIDLLGDGSIRLISTPGHTWGHMSVLLRVAGGRQVLIVGDAVYTLRGLREERLPLLTTSDETYLRSLRKIKAFSEQEPDAILVPTHDPTAWHQLRQVTASAENVPAATASAAGSPCAFSQTSTRADRGLFTALRSTSGAARPSVAVRPRSPLHASRMRRRASRSAKPARSA